MRLLTTTLLIGLLNIPTVQADHHAGDKGMVSQAVASTLAKTTWTHLYDALKVTKRDCTPYKTWIPDEGFRGLYCHMEGLLSFETLQRLTPMPIFVSGPHTDGLTFDSRYDFGHYNPEFIRWANTHFLPGVTDPNFRAVTQPVYDLHLKRLARTYYLVHKRLMKADNGLYQDQKKQYQAFIKARSAIRYEGTQTNDFYAFLDYFIAQKYERYEVSTAVLFWLRRDFDGTADAVHALLTSLLKTYDADFLES